MSWGDWESGTQPTSPSSNLLDFGVINTPLAGKPLVKWETRHEEQYSALQQLLNDGVSYQDLVEGGTFAAGDDGKWGEWMGEESDDSGLADNLFTAQLPDFSEVCNQINDSVKSLDTADGQAIHHNIDLCCTLIQIAL